MSCSHTAVVPSLFSQPRCTMPLLLCTGNIEMLAISTRTIVYNELAGLHNDSVGESSAARPKSIDGDKTKPQHKYEATLRAAAILSGYIPLLSHTIVFALN